MYEARGFTSKQSPIKECECGHVWRLIPLDDNTHRIDTIKQGEATDADSPLEPVADIMAAF